MEEIDLKELFSYYLSKLYIIFITIVAVLIIGTFYSVVVKKPLYQSNATIILAGKSSSDSEYTQSDLTLNQNLTKTYSQIIKSRKVLNKVKKAEGLDYSINELSKMISVSSIENTEIIKITVTSLDSEEAKVIANDILPVFTKEVSNIYNFDNISVLDKATVSKKPCNVNYPKEYLIYVIIGFVLGFGIIFIIYYFDNSIKSVELIEEKYELNVIGEVPMVSKER